VLGRWTLALASAVRSASAWGGCGEDHRGAVAVFSVFGNSAVPFVVAVAGPQWHICSVVLFAVAVEDNTRNRVNNT